MQYFPAVVEKLPNHMRSSRNCRLELDCTGGVAPEIEPTKSAMMALRLGERP
jgi:hypothetical protein